MILLLLIYYIIDIIDIILLILSEVEGKAGKSCSVFVSCVTCVRSCARVIPCAWPLRRTRVLLLLLGWAPVVSRGVSWCLVSHGVSWCLVSHGVSWAPVVSRGVSTSLNLFITRRVVVQVIYVCTFANSSLVVLRTLQFIPSWLWHLATTAKARMRPASARGGGPPLPFTRVRPTTHLRWTQSVNNAVG